MGYYSGVTLADRVVRVAIDIPASGAGPVTLKSLIEGSAEWDSETMKFDSIIAVAIVDPTNDWEVGTANTAQNDTVGPREVYTTVDEYEEPIVGETGLVNEMVEAVGDASTATCKLYFGPKTHRRLY